MKQGEIWLVNYPKGLGHEYFKERPALMIESNEQIQKTNILTIMAITSRTDNQVDFDILVLKNNFNNLHSNSVLKCHHITGFDKSRFIKRIGKIEEKDFEKVKQYLKIHFGI